MARRSVEDIAWEDLHLAKRDLVQRIWHNPEDSLWKVVDIINLLQELAIENHLWSFPEANEKEVVRKSDLPGPESPEEGDLCWDSTREVGMEWRTGEGWVDVSYSTWISRHHGRRTG